MSKQAFDPLTRATRAAETRARLAIANAETAIASMKRKRSPTIANYKAAFDQLGDCLQETNQLYDKVVAHSHLVAENIANRSQRNVTKVRASLLEVANRMLQLTHIGSALPSGVYNPQKAFDTITNALKKAGIIDAEPVFSNYRISDSEIGFVATYDFEQYTVSIVVTVNAGMKNLGEGSDVITVSVWENRTPPIWDTSFHYTAGENLPVPVGFPKGKSLGKWTHNTDRALFDYVANVLSNEVNIPSPSSPPVTRESMGVQSNLYATTVGQKPTKGSDQFDYQTRDQIVQSSVTKLDIGPQGELILSLNPKTINKSTLARYIQQIIQSYRPDKQLFAFIRLNKDGRNWEVVYASDRASGDEVRAILEGKL